MLNLSLHLSATVEWSGCYGVNLLDTASEKYFFYAQILICHERNELFCYL